MAAPKVVLLQIQGDKSVKIDQLFCAIEPSSRSDGTTFLQEVSENNDNSKRGSKATQNSFR